MVLMGLVALGVPAVSPAAETATCYNCPPEWADWASQLKAIKENARDRHPARQQELRPDPVPADRREKQPGRRHRLLRRDLRHPGQGRRGGDPLQAGAVGADPGRAEGPGGQLVHDPLRHPRALREQGRARRQARAANPGRTCSSPSTRGWSATSTRAPPRSATRPPWP
ncbi:MAG: hypothetical protein MZU91_07765 [Desulfosudis oleivorans]|nr:hypothetical protein [Desulfosudis oleivorans]